MAIRLEKGQRINLEKSNGSKLTDFCVGCNWGAIVSGGFLGFGKTVQDVDLDLSCVMVDANGNLVDHIYSPLYKHEFLARYGMPPGKIDSNERALHHSGDDLKGDQAGDDGLDNEIITVDLNRVNPNVACLERVSIRFSSSSTTAAEKTSPRYPTRLSACTRAHQRV